MAHAISDVKVLDFGRGMKRAHIDFHGTDPVADRDVDPFADEDVRGAAQCLFPSGRRVGANLDFVGAAAETARQLRGSADVTLYDPAFSHGGVSVRPAIAVQLAGKLHLVLVTSDIEISDAHRRRIALQAWCVEGAGFPLDRVSIAYIDPQFVYSANGDYRRLFRIENATQFARSTRVETMDSVVRCQRTLAGTRPEVAVGSYCFEPTPCRHFESCSGVPPHCSIVLPRIKLAGISRTS